MDILSIILGNFCLSEYFVTSKNSLGIIWLSNNSNQMTNQLRHLNY